MLPPRPRFVPAGAFFPCTTLAGCYIQVVTNAKTTLEQAARLAERAMKLHATRDARKNASSSIKAKMRGVRLILGRVI
jgi:hypothetical protein